MNKTNKEKVIRRAERKILSNIYYIYENLNVQKEIIKIRKKFAIPDSFFKNYLVTKPGYVKNQKASVQLFDCIAVWRHEICDNENTQKIIMRNLGKAEYDSFISSLDDKRKKGNIKFNFILNTLINYFSNDNAIVLHEALKVNPKIWGLIIASKLFDIPQEIIIRDLNDLTIIYFPSIDAYMRIQINELTSIEDIKYIWQQIKDMQREYVKHHNLLNNEDYLNHDRDKLAYDLRVKQSKPREDIKKLLTAKGYKTGSNISYITKMVKSYRVFIGAV